MPPSASIYDGAELYNPLVLPSFRWLDCGCEGISDSLRVVLGGLTPMDLSPSSSLLLVLVVIWDDEPRLSLAGCVNVMRELFATTEGM